MKIKSVIFDLDGTLIDSIEDIADCANKILSEHGHKAHPTEAYLQWIGNGARVLIEKAVPEVSDSNLIDKLLACYLACYTANYNIKTKVYQDMDGVLDFLSSWDIPFSILTNKPHIATLKTVEFYLKSWHFKNVYGQREHTPKKPDPTVALAIASDLKILPAEIAFIGDSSADIKTAIAAGMIPVGVTWGYGSKESMLDAGCKIFVSKPLELIELFSSIH